jgi:hypothetical protein
MSMTPKKLLYANLRPGDIYLTHSRKPLGRIIRIAQTMRINPRDDTTPTHGGIIVSLDGQLVAAEMDPRLKIASLAKYTGRLEQIVELYRPALWDDGRWAAIQQSIFIAIRRNMEDTRYDLPGAVLSSPLGHALFGNISWFRNSEKRQFCTEFLCRLLIQAGERFIGRALSPLQLSQALRGLGQNKYQRIYNYQEEQR